MHARRTTRFALELASCLVATAAAVGGEPPLAVAQPADPASATVPAYPAGGLTAEQIRSVIQANIGQVQHCYERGLARDPTLAGRVTVAFTVAVDGHVSESTVVDDSVGDPAVGECIAHAASTWMYPRPDPAGIVTVRFPFNLWQPDGPSVSAERLPGGAALWRTLPEPRLLVAAPSWTGVSDEAIVARIAERTGRAQTLPRGHAARASALVDLLDAYVARMLRLEDALDALRREASSACNAGADAPTCADLGGRIRATSATLDDVYRRSNATAALIVRDHPDHPQVDRVLFVLAHGLNGSGHARERTQVLLRIVDRYPSSPDAVAALEILGREAFDGARFEDARHAVDRALDSASAVGPVRAHLLMLLGAAQAALGVAGAAQWSLDEADTVRTSSRSVSSPYRAGDDSVVDDVLRRARAALRADGGS